MPTPGCAEQIPLVLHGTHTCGLVELFPELLWQLLIGDSGRQLVSRKADAHERQSFIVSWRGYDGETRAFVEEPDSIQSSGAGQDRTGQWLTKQASNLVQPDGLFPSIEYV